MHGVLLLAFVDAIVVVTHQTEPRVNALHRALQTTMAMAFYSCHMVTQSFNDTLRICLKFFCCCRCCALSIVGLFPPAVGFASSVCVRTFSSLFVAM